MIASWLAMPYIAYIYKTRRLFCLPKIYVFSNNLLLYKKNRLLKKCSIWTSSSYKKKQDITDKQSHKFKLELYYLYIDANNSSNQVVSKKKARYVPIKVDVMHLGLKI